jgi:hypothetical protein
MPYFFANEDLNKETTFKIIPNFPDYSISNIGRIIRNIDNEDMTHKFKQLNDDQFYIICLKNASGKYSNKLIDRFVADAFIDLPESNTKDQYVVRHLNGYNFDNKVENLYWVAKSVCKMEKQSEKQKRKMRAIEFCRQNPEFTYLLQTEDNRMIS